MKLKHILAVAIVFIIIGSMLVWSLFDDPAPDIDEQVPPTNGKQENTNEPTEKSNANIIVSTPVDNDTVNQSFQVQGSARVFENVVSYRVKNFTTGTVLVSGTTTADASDVGQFGTFTITIKLPESTALQKDTPLQLEVFQASAKDGSDSDKVTIKLKFQEM
jgi:hypothetical protein